MSKINIVNLSAYTSPEVIETRQNDWVGFGEDNNFFGYLIDQFNGSPTNNAVINGISQQIFGKGLNATDSNRKPDQYAQMISLLRSDCVQKFCYDLKLFGQCSMQIVYSKDKTRIAKVEHIPVETLRAEKATDGKIRAYYYHPDWKKYKKADKLNRIPAFGESKEDIEIMYVKPYRAGMYYYSAPDYTGGLQYAELESEIANFHLHNAKNSFAPSMLLNFNGGVPNDEERALIEQRIKQKFSGTSNAGKIIVAFNNSADEAATMDAVQLSDAHNQYQFLSEESMKKIMVAHRVVSPLLFGVRDGGNGLGSNKDELETAFILMENVVVKGFQQLLINAFDQILAFNDVSLNLYFQTLKPLEFTDMAIVDEETREEETGVKMSSDDDHDLNLGDLDEGELLDDEWELVDERIHNEENESIDDWAKKHIIVKDELAKEKPTNVGKLKKKPSKFSYLDKSFYKVRYRYAEGASDSPVGNTRKFCDQMMSRTKRGYVYRIEDIDAASNDGVNKSFGHKGKDYDLFRYKGGVNCQHVWNEVLYRLKKSTSGTDYKKTQNIGSYKVVDSIPKTYQPKPRGWQDAKTAPRDMKNNGRK
jgi:hypothetical protein